MGAKAPSFLRADLRRRCNSLRRDVTVAPLPCPHPHPLTSGTLNNFKISDSAPQDQPLTLASSRTLHHGVEMSPKKRINHHERASLHLAVHPTSGSSLIHIRRMPPEERIMRQVRAGVCQLRTTTRAFPFHTRRIPLRCAIRHCCRRADCQCRGESSSATLTRKESAWSALHPHLSDKIDRKFPSPSLL